MVLAGETENPAAEETVKEEAQAEEAGQAETEEVPEAAEENDGQIPAEQDEVSEPETTEVEDPDDRNDAKTSASDADSTRIEDVQVTVEEDETDEEESAYAGDTYTLLDVNAIGVVYLNSNRYADIKTYGGLQYYIMNGNEVYYKNGSSYELISVNDNYKNPKFTTASNSNLWNQPYYSGTIPAGELAKLYVKGGDSTAYSFALVYDANGGSGAPESQTGEGTAESYDFTADASEPVRDGYIYLGWAEAASATSAAYQAGDTVTVSTSIRFSSHADTSTYMANGLINAGNLLNGGAWTNTGNDKVVIVISDGIVADAENTISAARQLKNAGIKIYCANVTGAGVANPDCRWVPGSGSGAEYGDNMMYAISSQYSNPQLVEYFAIYQRIDFGEPAPGDYVYDADTTKNETWAGILNKILEEVVEFRTVNLGASSVMKDQINTEYFDGSGNRRRSR